MAPKLYPSVARTHKETDSHTDTHIHKHTHTHTPEGSSTGGNHCYYKAYMQVFVTSPPPPAPKQMWWFETWNSERIFDLAFFERT